MHLGDGAYVVPDPYGHPNQIWIAVNDHQNPVVALDSAAIHSLLDWLSDQRPHMLIAALSSAHEQHQRAHSKLNQGDDNG